MSASENTKPPGCWQLAFFGLLFIAVLAVIGWYLRLPSTATTAIPSGPAVNVYTVRSSEGGVPVSLPTPPAPVSPPPSTTAASPANSATDPYLPLKIVGGTFTVLLVPILWVVVADRRRKRRERAEAARRQKEASVQGQRDAERRAVKDRERRERRERERAEAEVRLAGERAAAEERDRVAREQHRRLVEEQAARRAEWERQQEERQRQQREAAAVRERVRLATAARQALWDLQSRYLAVAAVVQPALPEARFRELYTPLLSSADHAAVLRAAAALALQVDHAEILCDLLAHYHALEADLDGLYSRDFLEQVMRRFLGSADDLALARLRAQELKAELTRAAERPHPHARRRADERKAEAEVAAMRAEMTAKYAGLFPPEEFERAVREKAALIRRKYGLPEDTADD